MYGVPRLSSDCSLTNARCACCTVISITATSGSQRAAGSPSTRKVWLANAAILADTLTLDLSRVLVFTYAYACLNASWWLRLGGDDIVQWALKVAVLIEPHIERS
jgi:hypothetical protein